MADTNKGGILHKVFYYSKVDIERVRQVANAIQTKLEVQGGTDTWGQSYGSTEELWLNELPIDQDSKEVDWYTKGANYWKKPEVPPTVDGMLGGLGHISSIDINGSRKFLGTVQERHSLLGLNRALDCGAGIGRVTKLLLAPLFQSVDILEQCERFASSARNYVKSSKLENVFVMGMQDFVPEPAHYNVIWVQWVSGHLTDVDFVDFIGRMKRGLTPDGLICFKENTSKVGEGFIMDREDCSVTRSDSHIRALCEYAGLELVYTRLQGGFPRGLFPVRMYAWRSIIQEPVIADEIEQDAKSA